LFKTRFLLGALAVAISFCASTPAQISRAYPFRATNYDVEVILHPENQSISAQARVEFIAAEVSRTIVVELHPDLIVSKVSTPNGQSLPIQRDRHDPLLLTIGLPDTMAPGKPVSLLFEYSGPVSSEEDSPTKGVRFASVDKTSAYLLQPARWFPLTDYPANRYTGKFNIIVPETFTVVGTGKADPPVMQPGIGRGAQGHASYVFHCNQAGPVGTFVAGALQLKPVQTQGYSIPVYTSPAQASTAEAYGTALGNMLNYFSDTFGPLVEPPNLPDITISQMPDGSVGGYSAPGLLLVSERMWTPRVNERILSQLAAGQWWGSRVLPASAADVWLTAGLSRYAEAMFAEQSDGVAGLHHALEDFAIGALMYEEQSPISQAQQLQPYSASFRSVVADKGAMVFHMLRTELGNDAFVATLQECFKKHAGKNVTLAEFEKLAESKVPPPAKGDPPVNLVAFFSQWLNSTGIPEFKMDYIVYRNTKGFKIVGKIQQELDTFREPVEVKVDTEGNPEFKKILVLGTNTNFEISTFGRPKPNGLTIDPNNNLLKSSPRLRVRAAVARGEAYAQDGKYFEAIQEYQHALDVQPTNSLALFRTGEAMFYQKNYQAAANSFRAALGGDLDPKWIEVWSHIYIGKIYDLLGQRERAVNEYSLAQHLNDDTAGAQQEAARYMKSPYSAETTAAATPADADPATTKKGAPAGADKSGDKPVLKKRPTDSQ
jgi:hypothetical protein